MVVVVLVSVALAWYRWTRTTAYRVSKLVAEMDDRPGGFIDIAWHGRRYEEIEADFQELGPAAVPYLIEALRDGKVRHRYLVADQLGALGDRRAVELLIVALEDDDAILRAWSADALGEIGDRRAFEPLLDAIEDEEPQVRWAVVRAFGLLGDRRAVPTLIDCLDDPHIGIRADASVALGTLGDDRALEPLVQVLSREAEDSWVRREAATALGRLGDPRALPSLNTAAADPDPALREVSAEALRVLAR